MVKVKAWIYWGHKKHTDKEKKRASDGSLGNIIFKVFMEEKNQYHNERIIRELEDSVILQKPTKEII